MIKRLCALDLQAGNWIQAFAVDADSRIQLYVVNHSSTDAQVSLALIEPNCEVSATDIIISNAIVDKKSYRVFKDLEMPQNLALAVATEDENLTLSAVGVTIP